MTIHVAGGVYRELCTRPAWKELAGSGGRAAIAIGDMGTPTVLHTYLTDDARAEYESRAYWCKDRTTGQVNVSVVQGAAETVIGFRYLHDLQKPAVFGRPDQQYAPLTVTGDNVLRFGMLEGDAVVHAEMAVYDPQNLGAATLFTSNGSSAKRLAVVLNEWEAKAVAGPTDRLPADWAQAVATKQSAEVVVIRRGPVSALVWHKGNATVVPAYRTNAAFKIGSGDCFVAHFALGWLEQGLEPARAVDRAFKAMAYYSEHKGATPTPELLEGFEAEKVQISPEFEVGEPRSVYLAGPFFTTGQLWFIEEVMQSLTGFGLKVFSPFHDVGPGDAADVVPKDIAGVSQSDLLLAVGDGFDPGTVYEVGYARALGKPVVVLKESEAFDDKQEARLPEQLKMFEGDGCTICMGYTHAIYTTLWTAASIKAPAQP